MLRVMMTSTKQKFDIFKTFCVGDIFKKILDKFMNMVDFDIYVYIYIFGVFYAFDRFCTIQSIL